MLKQWSRMIPFIKPYTKKLIVIATLMILSACIDIAIPLFQSYAVDNFISVKSMQGLAKFLLAYAALTAAHIPITIIFMRLTLFVELDLGCQLKNILFEHLQTLSISYYNQNPVGAIHARVMNDTNHIGTIVVWRFVDVLWSGAYVIGALVTMFTVNTPLTLVVVPAIPIFVITGIFFQGKLASIHRQSRKANSAVTAAYNEAITGAHTIKCLGAEDIVAKDFNEKTSLLKKYSMQNAIYHSVYVAIISISGAVAISLVLHRGGLMVMGQLMTIGTLSAFISYTIGLMEPMRQVARTYTDFISAQINIERITALLDEKPMITDSPQVIAKYGDSINPRKENWESVHGDVEFRNICFRYPDGKEDVLTDFNLKVPKGSCVAIVGETGAGKSTLVNLLCRFYEPNKGGVLIDGRDIRERSEMWLHSNIGYVLQDPHLFSGSILENIRYGDPHATDEEVKQAAKLVYAHDIIENTENGYNTNVGEGGGRLSTGEKQLITLARAILAHPAIFVLDEATSSVDTHTEKLIQSAINYMLKGRTSFIIAHRLSTIREADIILAVRNGEIVEQGTHQELMAKTGYYHGLYTQQFQEYNYEKIWEQVISH